MAEKKFHVANFGCRASQSEGAAIQEELRDSDFSDSASVFDADVLIVNSCTVTAEADRDVGRLIRRVARRSPGTEIIVTGCYAQRNPAELAAMPSVRYVVGNSHKPMVPDLARKALSEPFRDGRAEVYCSDIFLERELGGTSFQGSGGRTRATVKVQDGCDANCSFCIIPSVRGRGRSLHPRTVIDQVRALVGRGYKEIVFSGIHLGSYGRDLSPGLNFEELVAMTLDHVRDLERLRLSSIEPLEVTPGLIGLVENDPRMARHFHVPLQSGSARVLRAMYRPYLPDYYEDLVRGIRRRVPEASIGADVMVGFPGETDDDFLDTYRLIESSPLTYLHVFPYSSRPGTRAAALADQIPDHVTRSRAKLLRQLIERKNAHFRKQFISRVIPVLVLDEEAEDGWLPGISDNFIKLRVPPHLTVNRWHRLTISDFDGAGLRATAPYSEASVPEDSSTTTAAETV